MKLLEDDIVAVARMVGDALLEAPLDPGEQAVAPSEGETVSSRVPVRGAFCGSVTVACSTGLARRLAGRMFGLAEEQVSPAEIRDASRELCNVIAGNLKILLPPPSEIGLPEDQEPPPPRPEDLVQRMTFRFADEPLTISVHQSASSG